MTAGNEGNEDLADDTLLPDDRLGELGLEPPRRLGDALERRWPGRPFPACLGAGFVALHMDAAILLYSPRPADRASAPCGRTLR